MGWKLRNTTTINYTSISCNASVDNIDGLAHRRVRRHVDNDPVGFERLCIHHDFVHDSKLSPPRRYENETNDSDSSIVVATTATATAINAVYTCAAIVDGTVAVRHR